VLLRRRVKPRPLGWALAVVAAAAFAFFVIQPAVYAVYLAHLPPGAPSMTWTSARPSVP
jgi:hypothetical protein